MPPTATAQASNRGAAPIAADAAPGVEPRTGGACLKRFRHDVGLTCQQLAERLGYSRAYLSAVENGSYPLSNRLLARFEDAFDLDRRALLSRDPTARSAAAAETARAGRREADADDDDQSDPDGWGIPLVDGSVAGGSLTPVFEPQRRSEVERCVSRQLLDGGPAPRDAYAVRVSGDSMAPRLLDGDIVIAAPGIAPRPGAMVVAIAADGAATVKLFWPSDAWVVLAPINPAYAPVVCGAGALEAVHAVIEIRSVPAVSGSRSALPRL